MSTQEPEAMQPAWRKANGRFAEGNPGKPRGARNRITLEIERLLEEAAPDAVRTILGAVKCAADVAAAKWIVDRVAPARRGRTVMLEGFPEIKGAADVAPALAAIATNFADGNISVEEAAMAARVLREFLDVLETAHRLGLGLGLGLADQGG
jgi:hypothetical protein